MSQEFINNLADKLQKVGSIHAIGETWISIDSTIPAGGVPFLGQLVSRSVWADLFAWATTQGKVKTESEWQSYASANGGNCPFYSDGDGSTAFRMPKIVSYIKGAASQSEAGAYTPEGLPNIEGSWEQGRSAFTTDSKESGAFDAYRASSNSYAFGWSDFAGTAGHKFTFDASRSSSIYGNSEHVTPETYSILIGVYAVGIVANVGSADATQFLNGLATLEANTNAHIRVVETWSSGFDWYRKWSDGWIEQGGVITHTSTGSVDHTVTFHTPFTNTNYNVSFGGQSQHESNTSSRIYVVSTNKSTTSMIVTARGQQNSHTYWSCAGL